MTFYAHVLISMLLAAITAAMIGIMVFAVRPEWVSDTFMAILAPGLYLLYFAAGSGFIKQKQTESKNQ